MADAETEWWRQLERRRIERSRGRPPVPKDFIRINKTTIAFAGNLVEVFRDNHAIRIDQLLDAQERLSGLLFIGVKQGEGYVIRTQPDRQTMQISLPKPIRPVFEQRDLYGAYHGEIGTDKGKTFIAVKFEK